MPTPRGSFTSRAKGYQLTVSDPINWSNVQEGLLPPPPHLEDKEALVIVGCRSTSPCVCHLDAGLQQLAAVWSSGYTNQQASACSELCCSPSCRVHQVRIHHTTLEKVTLVANPKTHRFQGGYSNFSLSTGNGPKLSN